MNSAKPLCIGIIAGEASGDALGAGLMHELKKRYPDARFVGVGGPRMIEEGCDALYPAHDLSLMGLVEIVSHLPRLLKIRKKLKAYFLKIKPDLFIGIDLPDFNLSVEETLKKAGIKTVHYVSPTVWAWREGRMKKIKRAVDLMLGIFPFEAGIYQRYGVPYQFVGHPLANDIPEKTDVYNARAKAGLDPDQPVLALLPGSRCAEISALTTDFLETAKRCHAENSSLQFVTSMVNEKCKILFKKSVAESNFPLPIKILQGQSHLAMAAADVVLLASGTATLEALLFKKPMIVAYRVNSLTYWIGRMMVKVQSVSFPNLLAGKKIVPEFLQADCTPDKLTRAVMRYFKSPEKTADLMRIYHDIRQRITQDANEKAAVAVVEVLRDNIRANT